MGTCHLAATGQERLGALDILQGLLPMSADIHSFTQNTGVPLPEAEVYSAAASQLPVIS